MAAHELYFDVLDLPAPDGAPNVPAYLSVTVNKYKSDLETADTSMLLCCRVSLNTRRHPDVSATSAAEEAPAKRCAGHPLLVAAPSTARFRRVYI